MYAFMFVFMYACANACVYAKPCLCIYSSYILLPLQKLFSHYRSTIERPLLGAALHKLRNNFTIHIHRNYVRVGAYGYP